jgi:hypothetical protein
VRTAGLTVVTARRRMAKALRLRIVTSESRGTSVRIGIIRKSRGDRRDADNAARSGTFVAV